VAAPEMTRCNRAGTGTTCQQTLPLNISHDKDGFELIQLISFSIVLLG
jgi:hypothetical protein